MSDEIEGTKCPRCGYEWPKPNWRCPECYYEFGTEVRASESDGKRTTPRATQESTTPIEDRPEQQVANTYRATDTHSAQYTRRGIGRIVNVLLLPAGGLLALVLGVADNSEGLKITGYVMLGIGAFILIMLGQFQEGLGLIVEGREIPKMARPQDTVETFFKAICRPGMGADDRPDRFYVRAFNCLTDTAQKAVGSLVLFQEHWDNLGYGWAPDTPNINRCGVSQTKQTAHVRVHIYTSQAKKGSSELIRKEFDKDLVLVERDGFWFMTDGVFLPKREIAGE